MLNEEKDELDKMILKLSKKLSNYEYVQKILKQDNLNYKESSVAVSYPALCILFSELQEQFPSEKFDLCAHKYLEIVNNSFKKKEMNDISLFDGLCGVGFAAKCMSKNGEYYQGFIDDLNKNIVEKAEKYMEIYKKMPFNELHYDVMYGLTGIANYLLNFVYKRNIENTLMHILLYIINICSRKSNPKFIIRSEESPLFTSISVQGKRYVNLGISHGIPGMLLLLINIYEAGICVPEQLETIKFLADYILGCCINNGKEVFWESQKIIGNTGKNFRPARDAWCYGTPGVAYSLLRASEVLKDNVMYNIAIDSTKLSLVKLREVISPTFCHGLSGLCCLARKFYEYTSDKYFYESYMKLLGYIVSLYSEEYPFGFQDKEIVKGRIINKNEIGLLTGVSGVILTIMSCYKPVITKWDSIFML